MKCWIPGCANKDRQAEMTLLKVTDLSIGYETPKGLLKAVEGISFSLERGSSLGLVGESGCGKTTMGTALIRLLPTNGSITKGNIFFEEQDLLKLSDEQMRRIRWNEIAMIFQAAMNALNPVHRVDDQIAEAILTHDPKASKHDAFAQVEKLFELVGIPKARMRSFPHQYSGGMKQRAVIAMALACRPKLIIADEPTTALDVIVQDQILKEIKALQKELNIGLIFISHDISIIYDVCDKIGVMYAGQLVEYGDVKEVFDLPMHPYTQALLASYPTLTGPKGSLKPIAGDSPDLVAPPAGCRFCSRCPQAGKSCASSGTKWQEITPHHKSLCLSIRCL
jgi:peptide/nickel transport system ATP-binding protein